MRWESSFRFRACCLYKRMFAGLLGYAKTTARSAAGQIPVTLAVLKEESFFLDQHS
jgi:hypothetical protein